MYEGRHILLEMPMVKYINTFNKAKAEKDKEGWTTIVNRRDKVYKENNKNKQKASRAAH